MYEDIERSRISPKRLTFFAAWSITFSALAGTWQYGWAIGSINAAYEPITDAIREHYEYRYHKNISSSMVDAVWVANSAAFPFGGIFGSFLVGPINKNFGRLRGILLGHFVVVAMSVLAGLSDIMKSPEAMIISRFGIGITSSSMGVGLTTMYVMEVSPKHLRGVFGSMIGAGVAFSIAISNVLALPQILGNQEYWPLLLGLSGVPSVLFIVLYKTLSGSTRHLYIEEDKKEKAIQVLRRLRGTHDVADEINDMENEKLSLRTVQEINIHEFFLSPSLRRSVLAMLVLATSFQLTGLNAISFNLNKIFEAAGIDEDSTAYVSIGVLWMNVVIHAVFAPLTDKYGRKLLLFIGYAMESVSLLVLTVSMETVHLADGMKYVSVVASVGFFIGFSVGPGVITFMIFSEFFEQSTRSLAVSVANVVMWTLFTIVVIVTPYMIKEIGGYTFLPYSVVALLTSIYIYMYIPETKKKTFREISRLLSSSRILKISEF